ncbi:MAG: 3-ketoacyl-ACP reductase [Gracilibacter sp. BRH_c7a]|nr:MAG: 3-ketoacyl-ACP reductase [Gracilibacter sp. BRH_c7a]
MNYKGKVVVVTGSGKGIGRCIAQTYASHEARVVIAEKEESFGIETESLIKNSGGKAVFVPTDVSRPYDVEQLMERVREIYGYIDVLINNAGVSKFLSPYELTIEQWDNIINTNLRSVFISSREAAKIMRENGGGSIVNISSTRAFMSEENSEAYAASKGGIIALTHALAASFSDDNIQVNSISPGWIATEKYSDLREIDHLQHWSKRVGKPEDIARACLYLTNEGNDFITGTNIVIDGGMTKKMTYEE